jgi:uncharacterized protein YecE (DUF72 family)
MELICGTSGFAYAPWKGPFYPEDLPSRAMLRYYASRLPAVEINNTFYRMPRAAMLAEWAAQTPASFGFVLKASRRITHIARLKEVGEPVRHLFDAAAALSDKLGPVLFQCPPNLRKDVGRLERFLAELPADRPVAIELRHRSWLDDEIFALLRRHRHAALCATEGDGQPEAEDGSLVPAELVATSDFGYLRLRAPSYDDASLGAWLDRIGAQPWRRAYVFFKHEEEGAAPRFALRALELARARGGFELAEQGGA